MTKAQALAMLEKRVVTIGEAAFKRIDEGTPKLRASAKKLTEALKSADSPDLIETLMRHLKLQVKPVAEGVALLDEVIKRLKEAEKDEELFELIADDMAEIMKAATDKLEKSRKDLREAKTLTDSAEKALDARGSDANQAGEEWASAYGEFERVVSGAAKEFPAWEAWEKELVAATDARDKARYDRGRKAIPKSALLDSVRGWPKGKPWAEWDKEFKFETLPKALQDEIAKDRGRGLLAYNKVLDAGREEGGHPDQGRHAEDPAARREEGADGARPAGRRVVEGAGGARRTGSAPRQVARGDREGEQGRAVGQGRDRQAREGRRALSQAQARSSLCTSSGVVDARCFFISRAR